MDYSDYLPTVKMETKTVFVTVGTTQFDKLILTVTSPEVCKKLKSRGYKKLLLQIGKGEIEPTLINTSPVSGFCIEYYRYKTSIHEDIEQADLVISHAGAGSCLETLGAGKPLLVVINEDLMNNHQLELANQLSKDRHIYYCNCSTLEETIDTMDLSKLKPFEPGQPQKFASFLDNVMGFS